jgi:hypothetical protein
LLAIKPLMHFFGRSEERDGLLPDRHYAAGSRIAACPSRSNFGGKHSETAQLDTIASAHCAADLIQNGIDNLFDFALVKMRIRRRDAVD